MTDGEPKLINSDLRKIEIVFSVGLLPSAFQGVIAAAYEVLFYLQTGILIPAPFN